MKRILCGIVVFLATAAWTQTSSGGSQDQSSSTSQGQTGSTSKGQTSGTKKKSTGTTLTGCLTGPNDEGVYVLKSKSSKKEIEVGGSDELSKHVNNEVKLHGSWAKSGSDIGEKEGAEAKGGEKAEKESAEKHFKVTSIDHIADTCPAAGSASKSGSSSKSSGHKGANKPSPSPSPGQ